MHVIKSKFVFNADQVYVAISIESYIAACLIKHQKMVLMVGYGTMHRMFTLLGLCNVYNVSD